MTIVLLTILTPFVFFGTEVLVMALSLALDEHEKDPLKSIVMSEWETWIPRIFAGLVTLAMWLWFFPAPQLISPV